MKLYAKMFNREKPLTIFAKSSILAVRMSFEYASVTHIYILQCAKFNLVNFLKFNSSVYQCNLRLLYFANHVLRLHI